MAWERELFELFEDLEQQATALHDADRAPELADRARAEYQQVTLASRLVASVEHEVVLHVQGVGPLRGRLARVAAGWCLLEGPAQGWVVRTPALLAVEGASGRAVPEVAWSPLARLGLGSVLRRLADAGERTVVARLDGGRHEGLVHRVGSDFVELLEGAQLREVLLPFAGLAAVSSPPVG